MLFALLFPVALAAPVLTVEAPEWFPPSRQLRTALDGHSDVVVVAEGTTARWWRLAWRVCRTPWKASRTSRWEFSTCVAIRAGY